MKIDKQFQALRDAVNQSSASDTVKQAFLTRLDDCKTTCDQEPEFLAKLTLLG